MSIVHVFLIIKWNQFWISRGHMLLRCYLVPNSKIFDNMVCLSEGLFHKSFCPQKTFRNIRVSALVRESWLKCIKITCICSCNVIPHTKSKIGRISKMPHPPPLGDTQGMFYHSFAWPLIIGVYTHMFQQKLLHGTSLRIQIDGDRLPLMSLSREVWGKSWWILEKTPIRSYEKLFFMLNMNTTTTTLENGWYVYLVPILEKYYPMHAKFQSI